MPASDRARRSAFSIRHRGRRACWRVIYALLFRFTPTVLHSWRRLVLRAMGARIGEGAVVHPSVKIWAPWNLRMDRYACLGPWVDCYNPAEIRLGPHSTVSQYGYLCSATHDYSDLRLPLIRKPIAIQAHAWVCADAYVGPGVTVGEGAVVGARSSVYKDVAPWSVVAGNPARFLKARILRPAEVS